MRTHIQHCYVKSFKTIIQGLFRSPNPGVPLHKMSEDFAGANWTIKYQMLEVCECPTYMHIYKFYRYLASGTHRQRPHVTILRG